MAPSLLSQSHSADSAPPILWVNPKPEMEHGSLPGFISTSRMDNWWDHQEQYHQEFVGELLGNTLKPHWGSKEISLSPWCYVTWLLFLAVSRWQFRELAWLFLLNINLNSASYGLCAWVRQGNLRDHSPRRLSPFFSLLFSFKQKCELTLINLK